MEISVNEVREVVESLPIGLYAHRRIPCVMDMNAETSFYTPADDKITISYPIIAEGLRNAVICDDFSSETAIRSMVYHELSHAILTPLSVMDIVKHYVPFDIFNVFEDERIETLLKDFYLDINFKKNILYINGGKITVPTSDFEVFYNLVRFRIDYNGLLPKVDKIINKHANINVNSLKSDSCRYLEDISALWEKVKKACKNGGIPKYSNEEMQNYQSDLNQTNATHSASNNVNSENYTNIEDKTNNDGKPEIIMGGGHTYGEELFKSVFDTMDSAVYNKLAMIISQFNKKNSGGNGTISYSGVFNPRLAGRNDYKYFERSMSVNGNNRYGSLHLNLMLDDSGSYMSNVKATNKIIQALIEIEKKNKNFSFDIYFVADKDYRTNSYFKATTNAEKYIEARGGNEMYPELIDLVRKAQKPNTFNYNLVLYDGQAYYGNTQKTYFSAFNLANTFIISDSSNKTAIEQYCPQAKTYFVSRGEKYSEILSDKVVEALSKAFR